MSEYKNPVCKGSFMLGSACGTCERCLKNLKQISDSTGLKLKSDYDQLLADARELQKALERARDRDFDWDLVHTKHSMEQLQVWRGKCLDALETFTKKYGSAE